MSNNKQSSVEWLYQEFERIDKEFHVGSHEYNYAKNLAFKISKAMHKEEIEKVSEDWWNEGASYVYNGQRKYNSFEQYYNETFGGNNED